MVGDSRRARQPAISYEDRTQEPRQLVCPFIGNKETGAFVALRRASLMDPWEAVTMTRSGSDPFSFSQVEGIQANLDSESENSIDTGLSANGVSHIGTYLRSIATQNVEFVMGVADTCIDRTGPGTKAMRARIGNTSPRAEHTPGGDLIPGYYVGARHSGKIVLYMDGAKMDEKTAQTDLEPTANLTLFTKGDSPTSFERSFLGFATAGGELSDALAAADSDATRWFMKWMGRLWAPTP